MVRGGLSAPAASLYTSASWIASIFTMLNILFLSMLGVPTLFDNRLEACETYFERMYQLLDSPLCPC